MGRPDWTTASGGGPRGCGTGTGLPAGVLDGNNLMRSRVRRSLVPIIVGCVLAAGAGGCDRKSSTTAPSRAVRDVPAPTESGAPLVQRVDAPDVPIDPKGTVLHVHWNAPPGTAVNEDAPFKVRWSGSEGLAEAPPEMKTTGRNVKDGFDVHVVPLPSVPRASLDGDVEIVVCDAVAHSVCRQARRDLHLGFVMMAGGEDETPLEVQLPAARRD